MMIIYCWIIIILIINFARPIENYRNVLLFHGGIIALVILLVSLARYQNRLVTFARLLYPVILMTFLYQNSGKLVHLFSSEYFDNHIVAVEKALFGGDISLWLDGVSNPWLTELFSATYFSYYFMIPGLALFLFFNRKDNELRRFMTATCAVFFLSYLIFILLPVECPRYHFATLYKNNLTGPVLRPLVDMVIGQAAFRGGAMPSSHVAEALVVMYFAIRAYGRRAYFMIAAVIGLALGTIYGRFHYISDVIAGGILGFIVIWLTLVFYSKEKDMMQEQILSNSDMKRDYVSNHI